MAHDPRQVLEVAPEAIELLGRPVDRDRLVHVHRAACRLLVGRGGASAELDGVVCVQGRDADDGRGGRRHPPRLRGSGGHRAAEHREMRRVSGHARPDPAGGPARAQDADAAGQFLQAHSPQDRPVGAVAPGADEPRNAAARRERGDAEPDAEPPEEARQALGAIAASVLRSRAGSTHLQHCLQQALWPGSHYPNHTATAWS